MHAFQRGESPEEILESFPMAGPLVNIYGALTFYLENKEQVGRNLEDQERIWADFVKGNPHSDSALGRRLRDAKERAATGQRIASSDFTV